MLTSEAKMSTSDAKMPNSDAKIKVLNFQGNSSSSGGDAFRMMASQFHQNRTSQSQSQSPLTFSATHHHHQQQLQLRAKKANNVWGAVLTEETLTSDMIGVGVGKRSLKELVNIFFLRTKSFYITLSVNSNNL